MAISEQQQELIDLLRNELAELIGYQEDVIANGSVEDKALLLEEYDMHAENIGNAAELVGLVGLANCCHFSQQNFQYMAANVDQVNRGQIRLLESWATLLLGYLQYFGDEEKEDVASCSLLDFLKDKHWPVKMEPSILESLEEAFQASDIQVDDESTHYPENVTEEMISLEISDDINPDLLKGLLIELPQQVEAFERAVGLFLDTEDMEHLLVAQRIAHTVKGAANVVGIPGMANLMHFTEDLLEAAEKKGAALTLGGVLQDASDCLSSISEYLIGIGPVPDELQVTMEAVLDKLQKLTGGGQTKEEDFVVENKQDTDIFDQVISDHQGKVVAKAGETPKPQGEAHEGEELPLLEDIFHRPGSEESARASSEVVDVTNSVPPQSNPSTPKETAKTAEKASVREGVESEAMLNITEQQAQELLRLNGEGQISTTQAVRRLEIVSTGLRSTGIYHQQLRQLALDLERLIEMQTGLASAASSASRQEDELDPLEMERYNELNSFASHLREVTTDADEAIATLEEEMKALRDLMRGQRQLAFESQDVLLQIRMLPVKVYVSRFQRCVRQAARLTQKEVSLEVVGDEVLADSKVMAGLVDPIMHLLRNAVDHGIERHSDDRVALGKPKKGQIILEFNKVGDAIVVTCRDDGKGLDYGAIERTAKAKGLLPEGMSLSNSELNEIILSSGFSTRTAVSQTSGRGVGLDVVNEQLRLLKGNLSIESNVGRGTVFTLNAPMSILSTHTLVVQSGDFYISIVSRALEQIIFIEDDRLEEQDGRYVYHLLGEDKPLSVSPLDQLVFMDQLAEPERYSAVIVMKHPSGARYGVMVESIRSSEEQIVKPVSKYTVRVPGVVGASILGDGRVSPVIDLLDLPGIQINENTNESWRSRFEQRLEHLRKGQSKERPMVLVVDDSLSARRSLAQFVGDMGLEVFTAKDGFEAIQLVDQKIPAVILADLEMPRMNGLELTNHLRADPKTRDIPIIMITSRATEKHRTMATQAGVNSYLNKPWSDEELLASIQSQMAS